MFKRHRTYAICITYLQERLHLPNLPRLHAGVIKDLFLHQPQLPSPSIILAPVSLNTHICRWRHACLHGFNFSEVSGKLFAEVSPHFACKAYASTNQVGEECDREAGRNGIGYRWEDLHFCCLLQEAVLRRWCGHVVRCCGLRWSRISISHSLFSSPHIVLKRWISSRPRHRSSSFFSSGGCSRQSVRQAVVTQHEARVLRYCDDWLMYSSPPLPFSIYGRVTRQQKVCHNL